MTLDDHILDEVKDILSNVSGLTIVSSRVANERPTAPSVHVYMIGETQHGGAEGTTREVHTELLLEVRVEGDTSEDALNRARNETKEAIEHALQSYEMAAYVGARYTADRFTIELGDASGLFDDKDERALFIMRITINYYKELK